MGFFKKNPPQPEVQEAPPPPPRRYDTVQDALVALRDDLSPLKTLLQPAGFTLNCFDHMPPSVMGGALSLAHRYDGLGSIYLSFDFEQSPHAAIFNAHKLRPKMHIKRTGPNMTLTREDLPGGKTLHFTPQDFAKMTKEIGALTAHANPQAAAMLYLILPDYAPDDEQIIGERERIRGLERPRTPPSPRYAPPPNYKDEFERLRREIDSSRIGRPNDQDKNGPRNPRGPRSVFY